MKGYVRLKEPDEEIFLQDGAGCVQVPSGDVLQYRVWDRGVTMIVPATRIITIRLGPGTRPEGYEPLDSASSVLADQPNQETLNDKD